MGNFTQHKNLSAYWFNKASDLHGSAAALYQAMEKSSDFPNVDYGLSDEYSMSIACPRVYSMLCGMALEALLKAIIIEKRMELRHSHNLNQLARDAGVTYPANDQKLLQILSEAIIWDGRYPVPKDEKNWDSLNELTRECLYDKKPIGDGELFIYSPNENLNWRGYLELWATGMTELCLAASWLQD